MYCIHIAYEDVFRRVGIVSILHIAAELFLHFYYYRKHPLILTLQLNTGHVLLCITPFDYPHSYMMSLHFKSLSDEFFFLPQRTVKLLFHS